MLILLEPKPALTNSKQFFHFFPGTIFSGNVGLAISQTLILTGMLQFGVRQTAEVISQMTSVERILQYTHIEREPQWDKGGT